MMVRSRSEGTPVRVAHVATTDLSLRLLLLNQMQTLRRAGFDVTGISSRGKDADALEQAGVRHIAIPMSRRYTPIADLTALLTLAWVLRREKFDLVHTHTPKAGLLGQYAAVLAGVPLRVHTIHGLYFPGHMTRRARFAYVLLERITMLCSHYNFSQNPEDIAVAIEERISRADRLELIGNGIDLSAFDPKLFPAERREVIRAALGFTPENLVVGMVARLVAEKGYLEMFEAVALVRKEEPRARFLFVGGFDSEKPDAIKPATLTEWKIDDIAQCLGHRNDMPDLYAAMDLHVLPSHREGFPRSPMEASAMQLPSIVTDVRGCRQTVDDGLTGKIVPVRHPRALADAILELLRDPARMRAMGAAAQEKARREFDEQVVFERVCSAYDRLLRRDRRVHSSPVCHVEPAGSAAPTTL